MKIIIRQKPSGENKASIYLDIHLDGQRRKEYLKKHIYLRIQNVAEKRHNKGERRNVNFIDYFDSLVKARAKTGVNYETWKHVLRHLKKFAGTFVTFADINDQWLENVKSYFLSNVSQNSAHTYFNKIKAAIHQAQRDGIIMDNPALRVKSPRQVDTKREFLTLEELQTVAATECRNPVLKQAFCSAP